MYPYHNKIKQRIKEKELTRYEFVEKYNGIENALLLHFDTKPYIRPIRPHKHEEYLKLIEL